MTTLQTPIEMQRPRVVRFGAGQVDTLAALARGDRRHAARSSSPTRSTPPASTSSAFANPPSSAT